MKVLVLLTCFNRKEKTEKCIWRLANGNKEIDLDFVIVDDNSNDGTAEMLKAFADKYRIHVVHGKELYYSGGMRKGMQYILNTMHGTYEYLLMVNDDVGFVEGAIERLVNQSRLKKAVIAGVTMNSNGERSYGAIKYQKGIHYRQVGIEEPDTPCDTFNANCVLIPYKIFKNVGIMDAHYHHSLGDFDYGLQISKAGYRIYPSLTYVGICENNPSKGSWRDTSLTRRERIRRKEYVKGAPSGSWFYFLRKNFGLGTAVKYTITPYVRILLNR